MNQETIWVVILIKGFALAKQRLSPALSPTARRQLARRNALAGLAAARAGGRVLAVAGSEESAEVAREAGAEVLLEEEPEGQNRAARRGIDHARLHGAAAVLLLSSDLPLVTGEAVAGMIRAGRNLPAPAVLAAPATGRGGTNALYLAPPDAIELQFGDDSLARFRREAEACGARFALHPSPELALDLDEPEDLQRFRQGSATA